MISAGREQSQRFSWKSHVNQLVGLCETLVKYFSTEPRDLDGSDRS